MWWRKCVFLSRVSVRVLSIYYFLRKKNYHVHAWILTYLNSGHRSKSLTCDFQARPSLLTVFWPLAVSLLFSFLSHCPFINFDIFEMPRIFFPRNILLNFVLNLAFLTIFIRALLMILCRLNSRLVYDMLILVSFYIYMSFYINWFFWEYIHKTSDIFKTKFPCRIFWLI